MWMWRRLSGESRATGKAVAGWTDRSDAVAGRDTVVRTEYLVAVPGWRYHSTGANSTECDIGERGSMAGALGPDRKNEYGVRLQLRTGRASG